MTVQVYDQIQAALEGHLLDHDGVPTDPATGNTLVAFENAPFTPVDQEPWWRVNFRPTTAQRGAMGDTGYSRADGIMIVELYYPAGGGSGDARRAADDLINHFKSGTRIESDDGVLVSIPRVMRSPGLSEPRWYHLNVEIWWTAYRNEL